MNEIKFRAWDKDKKKMCLVSDISFGDDGLALTIVFQTSPKGQYYRGLVQGESGFLMEWTGLKDKNGVEMYEGDIVKADWHWDAPHALSWPADCYDIIEYGLEPEYNLEVIGNIWENTDLLRHL